jgi:uncharacterized protein (TIGR02145 family)
MKKCKNLLLFAGLALFLAIGCGNHEEEKPVTPGNEQQKPSDSQTGEDKNKDKDKDASSDADGQSDANSDADTNSDADANSDTDTNSDEDQTKECLANQFGAECKPCTCQHGTCKDGKDGDGECSKCDSGIWTGKNCNECTNNKLGANCDIDTVVINGQTWTKRNMDVTRGNDGSQLTCYVNDFAPESELPDFVKNYGCLYMWADAMKVCPAGWHLPSKEEFEALLTYVGGVGTTKSSQNLRATSFRNGSDTYGFGALAAGFYTSGFTTDQYFGSVAEFWSATEDEKNKNWAYRLTVTNNNFGTIFDTYLQDYAYSVRCLKD